ncbi:MAG: CinA family protein [Minwuia sp.]|uniref:CinA family protein n=1 Tax=Minwuia sp. TaxID=2493630 RepID=UPI003A8B2B14
MFDPAMTAASARLLDIFRARGLKAASVESCTGGLIAGLLTEIAGSSDVVDRGFVTYSNEAKNELAGVPMGLIERHGAVSEPVAIAMAEGGLQHSNADVVVAVTGVAGPGGGSAEKPVGLVHLACARKGRTTLHQRHVFADRGRTFIRRQTVLQALRMLEQQTGG